MKNIFLLFVLNAILLSRLAFGETPLRLEACKRDGIREELGCGLLQVYENPQTRTGRKIDLHFLVLPALNPGQKEDPLFDLWGIEFAELYASELKPYRRNRDVVLIDMRGFGESHPLHCDRLDKTPQSFLEDIYPPEYVKACVKKLEKEADLSQYTTNQMVADIDAVRAALGYEKIHLIGSSFTSRIALVYILNHERHVSSAVVMGVVPTWAKIPLNHPSVAHTAMDTLIHDCMQDKDCFGAFPDLRKEWIAILEELKDKPKKIPYRLKNGNEVTLQIRRDPFAESIRQQLYTATSSRRLPYIIHEAAKENFQPFLESAIPEDGSAYDYNSDGMFLSANCSESAGFIDPKQAEAMNSNTYFGNYRVAEQLQACKEWPSKRVSSNYFENVKSDVPVLILSGKKDPVTPTEWAQEVARHLTRSSVVLLPNGAHSAAGLTSRECLTILIAGFLDRPDQKINSSCVNTMMPPPFFVP